MMETDPSQTNFSYLLADKNLRRQIDLIRLIAKYLRLRLYSFS